MASSDPRSRIVLAAVSLFIVLPILDCGNDTFLAVPVDVEDAAVDQDPTVRDDASTDASPDAAEDPAVEEATEVDHVEASFVGTPCTGPDDALVDCWASSGIVVGLPTTPDTTTMQGRCSDAAYEDCAALYLTDAPQELPAIACADNTVGLRVFANRGHFQFEDITEAAGFTSPTTRRVHVAQIASGDLDHDGCSDVVAVVMGEGVGAWLVWRGDCHGHFEDVTAAWGFAAIDRSKTREVSGLTLVDVDGDGRLDVESWQNGPTPAISSVVLAESQPNGTWALADLPGIGIVAPGMPFTHVFSDVDGNGALDLMTLNQPRCNEDVIVGGATYHVTSLPSQLFLNDGTGHFTEKVVPGVFGTPDPCSSANPMGMAAGDTDGDGHWEVFITDTRWQHHFRIDGDAWTDTAMTDGSGVGWNVGDDQNQGSLLGFGAAFIDWRRDGQPGLFITASRDNANIVQPYSQMLIRDQGTFVRHPELFVGGTDVHCSDGVAVGDYDGDAAPDVLVDGWGDPPQLLWNRLRGEQGLSVRLHGKASNTDGIGAKVTVTAGSAPMTVVTRELYQGSGPHGWSEPRLFFGLGAATAADSVVVRWPSGTTQTLTAVAPGRMTITEP